MNLLGSLALRAGKIGPDQPVVLRPEFFAGNGARGGAFNGDAVSRAWLAFGIAVLPLANLIQILDSNGFSKVRNRIFAQVII